MALSIFDAEKLAGTSFRSQPNRPGLIGSLAQAQLCQQTIDDHRVEHGHIAQFVFLCRQLRRMQFAGHDDQAAGIPLHPAFQQRPLFTGQPCPVGVEGHDHMILGQFSSRGGKAGQQLPRFLGHHADVVFRNRLQPHIGIDARMAVQDVPDKSIFPHRAAGNQQNTNAPIGHFDGTLLLIVVFGEFRGGGMMHDRPGQIFVTSRNTQLPGEFQRHRQGISRYGERLFIHFPAVAAVA